MLPEGEETMKTEQRHGGWSSHLEPQAESRQSKWKCWESLAYQSSLPSSMLPPPMPHIPQKVLPPGNQVFECPRLYRASYSNRLSKALVISRIKEGCRLEMDKRGLIVRVHFSFDIFLFVACLPATAPWLCTKGGWLKRLWGLALHYFSQLHMSLQGQEWDWSLGAWLSG